MSLYFGIKANIIGDFVLTGPIKAHYNGFQISIFIENGAYKISIIKRINEDSPLKLKYQGKANDLKPGVPDEADYKEFLELLRHFEALGGFNYGIRKINYRETLELTWYIGKDIFQNLEPILTFHKVYNPPRKKILSEPNLSSIFLLHKIIPDGLIPYNFYREATEYLNNEEYRQAYLHYYLILEYCFSNGKTSQKQQIDAFISNDDFILALLQTIKCFLVNDKKAYDELHADVLKLDAQKNKTTPNYIPSFTISSVTRLLYDYRGRLAHGSGRAIPYVFNEKTLRTVSLFISSLCLSVCGNMQVYSPAFTTKKNDYVNQYISKLKDDLNIS